MKNKKTVKLLSLSLVLAGTLTAQNPPLPRQDLPLDSVNLLLQRSFSSGDYRPEMPPVTPLTPNAGALVQYADYPVSHYTGVPQITVPLYDIVVDDYTLPLHLSYHASGIKAAQEASWVGLGWTLQAGGVISRTVKCYDDFLEYNHPLYPVKQGYYNAPEITDSTDPSYYTVAWNGSQFVNVLIIDSEPDIFYFSLPGASGKFLLDKSRGAVFFDKKANVKVDVLHDSTNGYHFRITTPDGVQYLFQTREPTAAYSSDGLLNSNTGTTYDDNPNSYINSPVTYTSSWYLTRITTATKREIHFTYERESYRAPTQESVIRYNYISHSGNFSCDINPSNNYYARSKTVHQSQRLSRISWDNGRVEFTASIREDLKEDHSSYLPKKLDSFRVYDASGNTVRGFNFAYDYFNADREDSYDYVFKRLKLNSVTDFQESNFRYTFNYYSGTLPAKNSKNTDYWGYPNGKSYGSTYYSAGWYGNTYYSGAVKTPSLTHARAGTLSQIIHPTGGSTDFTYELNQYNATSWSEGNRFPQTVSEVLHTYTNDGANAYPQFGTYDYREFTIPQTGTFRYNGHLENFGPFEADPNYLYDNTANPIFSLKRIEPTTATIHEIGCPRVYGDNWEAELPVRNFSLTAGTYRMEAFAPPRDVLLRLWASYDFTETPSTGDQADGGGLRIAQITADNTTRTFTYSGGLMIVRPILSYNITVSCSNNNYLSSFFYHVQLSESTLPVTSLSNGNAIGYTNVSEELSTGRTYYAFQNVPEVSESDFPFTPTQINFDNGLSRGMGYTQGNLTATRSTQQENDHFTTESVRGFVYKPETNQADNYSYYIRYYGPKDIQVSTGSPSVRQRHTYDYNRSMQQTIHSTEIDGDEYTDRSYYPSDFTDAVSVGMTQNNQVGLPVEELRLKNSQVILGRKTLYKDTLGMYLPKTVSVVETTVPLSQSGYAQYYVPKINYDLHNSYGKPLQVSDTEYTTVYLWSYNGEYPVAEIRNATYAQVAAILGSTFAATLAAKGAPTAADTESLNSLRGKLPEAFVTTYTYQPLVGVASVTDPRGFTTYYDYDSAGRLTDAYFLENGIRRVTENYHYHYRDK